ncbi:MAG: restriction endonuclease subunit S [Chlorobium sp.]|uniref:restriction endonuclease subunit S n=1 Tax=Chlorobium sp. TaxID=1095 RepID=UPI002F3F4D6D
MSSEMFLGDVAEITMGQSPAGVHCNKEGDGFPLLNGPTEFGDSHPMPVQFTTDPKKKANKGDLLFCVRGSTTGRMNWADQEYSIGRGIAAIRGKNGYPNSFIRTLIESQLEGLLVQATGSTFPNVSGKMLFELCVPEISVKSASAIAGIIEPIDDRIALLRETNATLESIAQAIFKSWFIDFDPVKAKQQGEEPQGMDAATAALFPDAFQDSELGAIPAGWKVGSLKQAVSIFDSKRIPLSGNERAKRQGSYPYYGAASVMDYIDSYLFEGVYFLMGEDGSVVRNDGRAVVQYVWGRFWVNNHAHILQGKNGITTEHAMIFAKNLCVKPYITGAVQAKLSQSNMWRIPFLFPSLNICECFGDTIKPIYDKIRANTDKIQTLASIRDALLPRLISGKLRLPEAEAMAGESGL